MGGDMNQQNFGFYEEARPLRDRFMDRVMQGHEMICPCCGQYARKYNRTIHSTMAAQIIRAFKLGGSDYFIHVSKLVFKGGSGIGDFPKFAYWGMIQEREQLTKDQRTSGYWKLTQLGIDFVHNRVAVPKYARVYNGELLTPPFEGPMVKIADCLGKKFHYQELMES